MTYVPQRADLVWITFDPQLGHEQAGHRPALVLSLENYNRPTGLMVACPVTNQAKGFPFEVQIPVGSAITGVILVNHVRSMDWRVRGVEYADHLPDEIMGEVRGKLRALLGL
jgi:mRNA interferase MazF